MKLHHWLSRLFSLVKPLPHRVNRRRAGRPPLLAEALEDRVVPTFTINATFASNIQNDANAATIEATIKQAIQNYENDLSTSITVNITFQETGSGLGANLTQEATETYANYLSALQAHASSSADTTALANLPAGPSLPAALGGGSNITLTTPLARALGFSANVASDSTISLNASIMNLSRPDTNGNDYDLLAVTMHELDEVIGGGSALDGLAQNATPPTTINPLDLYRFSVAGTRSFTTAAPSGAGNQAYFSIDGGATDLANFNQDATGDFGDWYSTPNVPNPPGTQVQDAFLDPGAEPNLGVELTRLDVLGYTVTQPSAPLPGTPVIVNTGGFASPPGPYVQVGSSVYFSANSELWEISNSTNAATLIGGVSKPADLTAVGNTLYFQGTDAQGNIEFYSYDGSTLTETMIGSFASASPNELTAVGNDLFFVASVSQGDSTLWEDTGSTVQEITIGANSNPSPSNFAVMGGNLYFIALPQGHLWEYDPSTSGTAATEIQVGFGGGNSLTAVGTSLFLSADDASDNIQLWQYNGIASSEITVGSNPSPSPVQLRAVGSDLCFAAEDGNGHVGLWEYNPTTSALAEDVIPNISLGAAETGSFVVAGTSLYFTVLTSSQGLFLYQYNGPGTLAAITFDRGSESGLHNLTADGSTLFFSTSDGFGNGQLWEYNGSGSPTMITFSANQTSNPGNLSAVGGNLYVGATTDGTNYEPWILVPSTPPAAQFSAAGETVNQSTGTFSITVSLSSASSSAVTVPFTLGGSAVAGTDYSNVTASPLTIPAGQTSATITGTLLADPDATPTLTFTLGSPTGATLGATTVNTLTINEPVPSVEFSATSESVNESAGTFSITVNLSAAAASAVNVPFTLGGSAVAGTDYSNVTASPLSIPAGQSSGTITGTLLSDPGATPTLTFTLGTPTGATLGSTTVNTLTINQPVPTALFSDSFDRAGATEDNLGQADNALGGTGTYYYVPIFANGASISGDTLQNNLADFGGVQFSTNSNTSGTRGTSVGQDLDITVDLLVPTNAAGDISEAGVYFRSRAAFTNDGIIGGAASDPSGGYWVRLLSNGMIEVLDLRNNTITAFTAKPTSFDPTVFHSLQIAASGNNMQVALDGVLQQFDQAGSATTTVAIPATGLPGDTVVAGDTSAGDAGAAGIAFGAPLNRGAIGGQEAQNLVVASYTPLTAATNGALLVTNTSDSGPGSLRQAITDSNNGQSSSGQIQFAVAESGVQTIAPASPLPTVTTPVDIEGNTEPFTSTPLVAISGTNAGAGANGLTISADDSTVSGLAIENFTAAGVSLSGTGNLLGGIATSAGDTITGNGGAGIAFTQNVNAALGNSVYANGTAEIQLAANTNLGLQPPTLATVTLGTGTVNINGTFTAVDSGANYRLDFFASPAFDTAGNYEGEQYLGSTTLTNVSSGAQPFSASLTSLPTLVGQLITATVTDLNNTASATSAFAGPAVPIVLSVVPSLPTITGAQVGTNSFALTVTYTGPMNTSVFPTIAFSPTAASNSLTLASRSWNAAGTVYTAIYNVLNKDVPTTSCNVTITGAVAASGPTLSADNAIGVFSIDTANPIVLTGVPSSTKITDAQVGGTFTLALVYNEAMNTKILPTITFIPSLATTLTPVNGIWSANKRVFTASYKVKNAGVVVPSVAIAVTGAADTNGNVQLAYTDPTTLAVDTASPTATAAPSVPTIADAQLGRQTFALAISYNKPMNVNLSPTVALSPAVSTTLSVASQGWNAGGTVYTVTYNIADVFVSVPTVTATVSGAKNLDGNVQTMAKGTFAIDTVNPTVTSVTSSVANITGAQEGQGTFSLTITYSGPMNKADAPTISFVPPVDSTLSPTAPGMWNAAGTSFVQTYNVADSGMSIAGVSVAVSGAFNNDGNLEHSFEAVNRFTINTINPTVVSATPSTANITTSGKNAFRLTIVYSTAMNTKVSPTILFSPDVSSTLTPASGVWSSSTVFVATYNVASATVSTSGIQATITGGESSSSSLQLASFQSPAFAINLAGTPSISVTTNNTSAAINSQDFGESFVAPTTGLMTQLNVLNITNMYSPLDQSITSTGATLEIFQGGINTTNPALPSYDTPAGSLLYSQSITFGLGNNDISLTTPLHLVAGQTYLWQIVPNNVSAIYTFIATNNPYAQGDTLAGPLFGYDLDFQIYI